MNFKRLDTLSIDNTKLNLEALYRIAPSVFTEAIDPKTGKTSRKVDFEALRQLLGDMAVDGEGERYRPCAPCRRIPWTGKTPATST